MPHTPQIGGSLSVKSVLTLILMSYLTNWSDGIRTHVSPPSDFALFIHTPDPPLCA